MDHHRILRIEKIQVQIVAVAALLVGYFFLAPALWTWDAEGPITFVPLAGYSRLVVFAISVSLIAAVAGVLTVKVRPQGALLAVLVGAGGVSLHSPEIRSLLWMRHDSLPGLFAGFAVETFLLLLLLVGIELLVSLARGLVRKFRHDWLWRSPLDGITVADKNGLFDRDANFFLNLPALRGDRKARRVLVQCGLCLIVTMVVAVAAMLCFARSADRGQILFALLISFLLAQLIAHWVFPVPYSIVAWSSPMLVGIGSFCVTAATLADGRPQAWADIPMIARALPIDWMTAGGGGALMGFWISSRVRELRHMEKKTS